ncbi:MAG: MFS transporter [Elusimicrobia bacterium]|nr:MFS transporter [Elusimicrobiota bacterium]
MSLLALCLCQLAAICAYEMGTPFIPALLASMGVSETGALMRWTGWADAAALGLGLFSTPFWARLGDARGRKLMLLRAHLGLGAALFAVSLARTPLEVVLARALQGALAGVTAATLAAVSEEERASSRMGWVQSSCLAGAFIGPFLGALVLRFAAPAAVFRAGAVLCLLSLLATALFVGEPARKAAEVAEPLPPARGFGAAGALAAWIFAWRALEDPVLPVYARQLAGESSWALWMAVILGASRLTAMLSAPAWGRWADRLGPERVLRAAVCGTAALTLAQLLARGPLELALVRAALGLFAGAIATCVYAEAVGRVPGRRRGEAVALAVTGGRLGDCVGSAGGGVLAAAAGVPGLFAAMGAGLLSSLLLIRRPPETA